MITTRLTRRFAIKHPILGAPMALIAGGRLAAGVTAAGGLGLLGGGYAGTLGNEPDLDEEYRAAGNTPIGIGFITWAAEKNPKVIDWAIERRPACLFLSFGNPAIFARKAGGAGIPVICQAQTLRHVEEALDAGAMAIVAQGGEAGGHGGRRGTLSFVPEVADLLAKRAPDVLLLAAGGIADGRGLAASLMLGADGVLVGTRFWAADEALTPPAAVARAAAANGDATVRTSAIDPLRGAPWPKEFSFRMMRNRVTDEWADREQEARGQFGALKPVYDTARERGDFDVLPVVAGEAVGLIGGRFPAADILSDMVSQAERALQSGSALIEGNEHAR
jgi:nitronate monooxygenase